MFTVVENVLEALYVYQISAYYKVHLAVLLLGILAILWLFLQECRIKTRDSSPA
jgi:hypothetical protein